MGLSFIDMTMRLKNLSVDAVAIAALEALQLDYATGTWIRTEK